MSAMINELPTIPFCFVFTRKGRFVSFILFSRSDPQQAVCAVHMNDKKCKHFSLQRTICQLVRTSPFNVTLANDDSYPAILARGHMEVEIALDWLDEIESLAKTICWNTELLHSGKWTFEWSESLRETVSLWQRLRLCNGATESEVLEYKITKLVTEVF